MTWAPWVSIRQNNSGVLWLNGALSLIEGYFEPVALVMHGSPLLIDFAGFERDGLATYPAVRDWLGTSSKALLFGFEEVPQFPADCSELVRVMLVDGKLAKLQPSFPGFGSH